MYPPHGSCLRYWRHAALALSSAWVVYTHHAFDKQQAAVQACAGVHLIADLLTAADAYF